MIGTEAILTDVPEDDVDATALSDSTVTIGTEAAVTDIPDVAAETTALSDSAVTIGTDAAVTDVPDVAAEVASQDIPELASEGAVTAVMTGVVGVL